MSQLERIGVSLEKELLSRFDKLINRQGYQSRSEALRDLVRRRLSEERLGDPKTRAVAVVFMVYDHHSTKLAEALISMQHKHIPDSDLQVISSLHIHLDEHDCLEIIIFRGLVGQINKAAEGMLSMKGVKLGRINIVAV
jgi:CopG family nickel-responsive transcriptional regulator